MTEQAQKLRQAAEQMNRLAELDEEEEETKDSIEQELDIELGKSILNNYIMSEYEEINKISEENNLNITDAKKQLPIFPNDYLIEEHSIPDLVKKMRNAKRSLKGEQREKMTKAIDSMIDAYSDHLNNCIKSITWLNDYTSPLKKMRYNEKDLFKLYNMKTIEERREVIDSLCKYWEAELDQKDMAYSKEYSDLSKQMASAKKDFRESLSKVSQQSLTKSKKESLFALKFEGFINLPNDGIYTFYSNSDDGSQIFIHNNLIVDNDFTHGMTEKSGEIALAKGFHPFKVTFFQGEGGKGLEVSVKGPGIDKQVISSKYLFH